MKADWLARCAKSANDALPVDAAFVRSMAVTPTRRTLLLLADDLLAIAELGDRPLAEAMARRLRATAAGLERSGLSVVAHEAACLTRDKVPSPKCVLRATHIVDRALAMTRPLPWLQQAT